MIVCLIIIAIIFTPVFLLLLWILAAYTYFIWKDWPVIWQHIQFWKW